MRLFSITTLIIILLSFFAYASAETLFEFTDESTARWGSVDDSVMGGISASQMSYVGDGIARFAGNVSLENNGGFASVRHVDYIYNLSEFEGVELLVKGNGMDYQFRMQTNIGRMLPDAPELNTEFLRTLTFMLSDKQEGDFELLVDSIKVY